MAIVGDGGRIFGAPVADNRIGLPVFGVVAFGAGQHAHARHNEEQVKAHQAEGVAGDDEPEEYR